MSLILPHRNHSPIIAPDAFIAHNATVIGDVEIGSRANLWFGVIVRGDVNRIRIGARTNVQDGTMIHCTGLGADWPTLIGDDVTIGHAAVVHGCTIDSQCLIGMGAILLNGCHIGSQSIVAAGTLIVEDMKVPPRSLVMGSPGKVKRLLTHQEIAGIQQYADRYVGYRLDYMGGDAQP